MGIVLDKRMFAWYPSSVTYPLTDWEKRRREEPSTASVDRFLALKCAGDLIDARLFPNAKEISEAMTAYEAVQHFLWEKPFYPALGGGGIHPSNPTCTVIVVGDGNTPRTGALFAARGAWEVVSIDPRMKDGLARGNKKGAIWERWLRNLHPMRETVEDCLGVPYNRPLKTDPCLLVFVHSHAKLSAAVSRLEPMTQTAIISIPCCVKNDLRAPPDYRTTDPACLSKMNEVLVWKRRPAKEYL